MTNENKSFSMMVIFGSFILLLGILMDDLSTLILYLKGYGVLESNPIALALGIPMMFVSNFIIYIFMLSGFWWVVKLYRKFYAQRAKAYKIYDIFVFLFCLIIVSTSMMKIEAGWDNYSLLKDTEALDQEVIKLEALRMKSPDLYNMVMAEEYGNFMTDGISYIQIIINGMLAFLLFKVDNKVSPWFL